MRSLQAYRSSGGIERLEEEWLAAVEEAPGDPEPFCDLAQDLARDGEEPRARSLLELYDAELKRRNLWAVRLALLRRAGSLVVRFPKLQKELLATLEQAHPENPELPRLIAHCGLDRNLDTPNKLFDAWSRLESLLAYTPGTIVEMAGHGVGRIREVNLQLDSLQIELPTGKILPVGLRAAGKLVRILPPENFWYRRLVAPQELALLAEGEPSELLRLVLESAARPLSASEIRAALADLLPEKAWNRWWAQARKHPSVVASSEGKQTYRWEGSPEAAQARLLDQLGRAEPREKLRLFRQNVERLPDLAAAIAGDLASLANEVATAEPGFAFEIWFTLERAGHLPAALESLLEKLLGPDVEPTALLEGIEDRLLKERALLMLRERREDWPAIFRRWFGREKDPKVLDTLARQLGEASQDLLARLADDVLAAPHRARPQFVWLAERAAADSALRARAPLRLLQQILTALASEEFQPWRSRLRALIESGGTVSAILAELDADQADSAREAIEKCGALSEFERQPLQNTLSLRFREAASSRNAPSLRALPASIEAKRQELRHLIEVEIPANRKAIAEARALGDLRENFEYKSARQRHEYLNARAAQLHHDLARSAPIEIPRGPVEAVHLGTRLHLEGAEDSARVRELAILGPWESDPAQGILSYESELAATLLGKRVGDLVVLEDGPYRVARIEPWSPTPA